MMAVRGSRAMRPSASVGGPGTGSARSKQAASSRWQKYGERKSSGRQTTPAPRRAASRTRADAVARFSAGSMAQRIWTRAIRSVLGAALTRAPCRRAAGESIVAAARATAAPLWSRLPRPGSIRAGGDRMDLSYTPEEEALRARVRAWLKANVPAPTARQDLDAMRAWQRTLHAAGYVGASWPKEFGGAGLSDMEQAILNEELAFARAPGIINAMAVWWVGPAIMRYGTDEQKRRFIPPILTADEIWATGYSEPTSGSDMAAARTRAVRDGDHYVVSGQKIWTTLAHIADWFFVLVRTSTEGPKWAGLSLLLMDMRSPGIEVRPIRQIDGGSEFNEVFMTEVRVPVANLRGREGQGWEVVSSALINERTGIAGSIRFDQALDWLATTARSQGRTQDPCVRQRIAELA